jgi:thiol-disulfide isomerase/thioredoxin
MKTYLMKTSKQKQIFRIILFLPLFLLLLTNCSTDRKSEDENLLDKTTVYFENSEYDKALQTINEAIEKDGLTNSLIDTKYKILLASKKYEEALVVFDTIIGRMGFTPDVVADKIRLLMTLGRYDEAMETAIKVDEVSDGSSPYVSLSISRIFIAKSDPGNALIWLEETADRGFTDYNYLLGEEFESIHTNNRFNLLIGDVKENAGIGTSLKTFSIPAFSGNTYDISSDNGKVILLDFWATWCPPCVAENENLNELYTKYKDHGFEIVSISADSNRESLEKYLEKHNIPWINGFSGKGRKDEVVRLYNIDSYPTYIIVDRFGIIRYVSSYGGEKLNKALNNIISE